MREKIRIPRRVEAKFQLFGLGFIELLCMLPLLGVAVFCFQTMDFTFAIVVSIFVVGLPYGLLSHSKHGRSGVQYVSDILKYYFKTQKRYEWSWADEDCTTQIIRYEKHKQ